MRRTRIFSRVLSLFVIGLACSVGMSTLAADANNVAIQKLYTDLKNPNAVAVRPAVSGEPTEIFVAVSGAGRVVKFSSDKPGKTTDVLSGFPGRSAEASLQSIGVQSLYFLDHKRLVVAGGGDDGKPFVRLYEIPDAGTPLTADQSKQDVELTAIDGETHFDAQTFRGIARTQPNELVGDHLILAAWRDREPAGLVSIPIRAGTLGDPVVTRLKNSDQDIAAQGIAVGNNGYVVAAIGSPSDSNQTSNLAFFNPLNRRVVMRVPVELRRIVALAYSPKSGNLYAANISPSNDGHAGIYRIDRHVDQSGPAGKAAKIADVRRPTALAFAPDGALYVTSSGDSNKNDGILLKLSGEL